MMHILVVRDSAKIWYRQYYLPVSGVTSLTGQAPVNGMSLRKQTDGRVFKKEEFIELDEMRKLLFAGNPSDSDPGYEVPHAVHCSTISRGPTNCKKGTQRGPNFEQKGDMVPIGTNVQEKSRKRPDLSFKSQSS